MIGVLNDFFDMISEEEREVYSRIAEYALSLGFKCERAKTKDINYVFKSNKTKRHILKFSINKGMPEIKMKYFASKDYSKTPWRS